MQEDSNTVYGRLLESVHISNYSTDRACDELEYLLEGDRWKAVGKGYDDINEFARSLNPKDEQLRFARDRRKKLAEALDRLGASQRATAKALGVSHTQVQNDLGKRLPPKSAEGPTEAVETEQSGNELPSTRLPFQVDASDISKATKSVVKRQEKEQKKEEKRDKQEQAIAKISDEAKRDLSSVCDIRQCSMAELLEDVKPDCIITDPPYPKEFLHVYGELAEASKHVPLVAVMVGQSYLPQILSAMTEHLPYLWTMTYLTPGGQAVQLWQAKVNTFWKPILLFGELPHWIGDVVSSDTNDNDKEHHYWGQSESGMANLIERLSQPGDLVCDPFMGGGTTAVTSIGMGRRFVGCDIDADAVTTSRERCEETYARS